MFPHQIFFRWFLIIFCETFCNNNKALFHNWKNFFFTRYCQTSNTAPRNELRHWNVYFHYIDYNIDAFQYWNSFIYEAIDCNNETLQYCIQNIGRTHFSVLFHLCLMYRSVCYITRISLLTIALIICQENGRYLLNFLYTSVSDNQGKLSSSYFVARRFTTAFSLNYLNCSRQTAEKQRSD